MNVKIKGESQREARQKEGMKEKEKMVSFQLVEIG